MTSTTQTAALTATQIRAMKPWKVAQLEHFDWLNTSAVNALSSSQLRALCNTYMDWQRWISPAWISAINPDAISGLVLWEKVFLTSTQIAALTADQIRAMTLTQVTPLLLYGQPNKAALNALSGAQLNSILSHPTIRPDLTWIKDINPNAIAGITTGHLKMIAFANNGNFTASLTAAQIGVMTLSQVASLPYFDKLNKVAISALSSTQLNALFNANLNWGVPVSPDWINAINPGAIAGLSKLHLNTLTTTQTRAFTASQIRAMSPEQVSQLQHFDWLNKAAINALSSAQLNELCKTEMNWQEWISSEWAQAINPNEIRGVNVDVLMKLIKKDSKGTIKAQILIDALTSEQFHAIKVEILEKILTSSSKSINRKTILRSMNAEQLSNQSITTGRSILSYYTSKEIQETLIPEVTQALPISILGQMDAEKNLIASTVFKNLSEKQVLLLDCGALKTITQSSNSLINVQPALAFIQTSGAVLNKGMQLNDERLKEPSKNVKDAIFNNKAIGSLESLNDEINTVFGFRDSEWSQYIDATESFSAYLSGWRNNFMKENAIALSPVNDMLEKFKGGQKGNLSSPLIDEALLNQAIFLLENSIRYSASSFGEPKPNIENFYKPNQSDLMPSVISNLHEYGELENIQGEWTPEVMEALLFSVFDGVDIEAELIASDGHPDPIEIRADAYETIKDSNKPALLDASAPSLNTTSEILVNKTLAFDEAQINGSFINQDVFNELPSANKNDVYDIKANTQTGFQYGGNIADASFRFLQWTKFLYPGTTSPSVAVSGSPSNLIRGNTVGIGALNNMLARFKTAQKGRIPAPLIDVALAAQTISLVANVIRWSRMGYGGLLPEKEEFYSANQKTAFLGTVSNMLQASMMLIQAHKSEDKQQEIAYGTLASASFFKSAIGLMRVFRRFDKLPGYAAGIGIGDLMGFVGSIMLLSVKGRELPNDPVSKYMFASQIINMAGGGLQGLVWMNAARRIAAIPNSAREITLIASGPRVISGSAAEALIIRNSALRFAEVIGGVMSIIAAANPVPYLSAKSTFDTAMAVQNLASKHKASGSPYIGDQLLADFLREYGTAQMTFAAFDTTLMTGVGAASIAGQPELAVALAVIQVIVAAISQGIYDAQRVGLADKILTKGGINYLYEKNLLAQNKLYMDDLMKTYPSLLADSRFNKYTLIGGQSLTDTAVVLGLYAANYDGYGDLSPLFSQGRVSVRNFANTITEKDAVNYTAEVNVFDGRIDVDGHNLQHIDLSGYIKRSEEGAERVISHSGIKFFNPLALPSSSMEVSNTTTNSGKDGSVIQYLNSNIQGGLFNLAAQDLSSSEYVYVDLSNLLVNYISTDSDGKNPVKIALKNEMNFGNAQYYIYGSLADFYFKNSSSNSGQGSAIIDYTNLGDTKYDASIRMVAGSSLITVHKNLIQTEKSFYYQENNNATQQITSGKKSATAKYLQFGQIKEPLTNQADVISGSSSVNSVIALKGSGNVMTGYNGWTLRGGESATYVFNRNTNNFNASTADAPASIDIYEGLSFEQDAQNNIDISVSKMNYVSVESLLSVRDVYFYLNTNLRDLSIVNVETNQIYKVFDFMDNSEFNTIYLTAGSSSYSLKGSRLAQYFRDKVEFETIAIGLTVRANFDLLEKLNYTINNGNTETITGVQSGNNTYYRGASDANMYRVLDYSKMSGFVEVDCFNDGNKNNLTVYKYDADLNQVGIDLINGCNQIFGTDDSDSYLNINGHVLVSDSSGHNTFEITNGGKLELSGLEGVGKSVLTDEIDVYVNNLTTIHAYMDAFNKLHIVSMDASNDFSISINQYGKYIDDPYEESNVALKLFSSQDHTSLGYLNVSGINSLVSSMASIDHSTVTAATWKSLDVSNYMLPSH